MSKYTLPTGLGLIPSCALSFILAYTVLYDPLPLLILGTMWGLMSATLLTYYWVYKKDKGT